MSALHPWEETHQPTDTDENGQDWHETITSAGVYLLASLLGVTLAGSALHWAGVF